MLEEKSYLEYLKKWINGSGIFATSISNENEEVVVIAMSRKMPRLLKWIIQERQQSLAKNVILITEHAIPFCVDEIKGKRIIVIDDAIYYGTTVENVVENIAWCTGQKDIEIASIIKRQETRDFSYGKLTVNNELKLEDIPFYTTRNAANIMSLGIPMDMEYPILYFKMNRTGCLSVQEMENYLKRTFEDKECYVINHQVFDGKKQEYVDFINLSILLDPKDKNADFSKLRLYISDNKLMVVAYSPFVISQKQLEQRSKSIKFETTLNEIWDMLLEKVQSCEQGIDIENPAQKDIMKTEYRLRRQRSLVVGANYLESFRTLLQLKNKLELYIESIGFSKEADIEIQDLKFLFGNRLCRSVREKLLYAWNNSEYTVVNESFDTILTKQAVNLIPSSFEESYMGKNRMAWSRLKDTSTALSAMFSNLHFYIGLASLKDKNFEKLRFGESFASMDFELAPYIETERRLVEIHKWIDRKIDEGCVAPKYELVNIGGSGEYCWKRLFRAGENENDWTKMARFAFHAIERMESIMKTRGIERRYIDEVMAVLMTDPLGKIKHDYRLAPFKARWKDSRWQLFIQNENDEQDIAVIPTLEVLSFLQSETTGTQEYIKRQDNVLKALLGTAIPTDEQQTAWVDAYIDLYVKLIESNSPALASHFFLKKEDITLEDLSKWISNVNDFFKKWIAQNYFDEELNNLSNELSDEILSIFLKRMTMQKEDLEAMIEEQDMTEEYKELKQSVMENPVLEQNVTTQREILRALFYWESFIAIFKKKDTDYARYSINVLINIIKEDVPDEIQYIMNNGIPEKTIMRNVLKFKFQKIFNNLS